MIENFRKVSRNTRDARDRIILEKSIQIGLSMQPRVLGLSMSQ
jgi:hypothetical protein